MRVATIQFLALAWLVALLAPSIPAEGQAGRMATAGMHSVTREILGVREAQSSSETGLTLVATIQ
jgi:hypothetical protein